MIVPAWVADTLVVLHLGAALATALHALLFVRDPRAAWGWIAACWLAPLVGVALYLLFGTNRLESRARHMRRRLPAPPPSEPPAIGHVIAEELRELVRIGDATSRRALMPGNRVAMLRNGDEAYPAMLDAIARATRSIRLSSYIFSGDDTGRSFALALAAARSRGVDVRVLIDAIGDLYYWPRGSRLLRRHEVPVRRFQLAQRFLPLPYVNLRNHRKLLIVDDATAFTGGINIGDHHVILGNRRHPTRDLHFRVEGPVIAQLAEVFESDWAASGDGQPVRIAPPASAGSSGCRAITVGPDEDLDRLELILLGALSNAHRRVSIMTPYFIPMAVLSRALESAALRGVEILLVLPERSNLPWVDWASRRWLRGLLAQGVRVVLCPPPFAHSKVLVVDDYYSHVGSANLDSRSLQLNFELVLETYCRDFAAVLQAYVDDARAAGRELTAAELAQAGTWRNLRDAVCWLFSPYL